MTDTQITIETPEHVMHIGQDPIVEDWCIWDEDGNLSQGEWIETKEGAVQYALSCLGIVEEADYTRSPDHTF